MHGNRAGIGDDAHALGGGEILFEAAGIHPLAAPAIDKGDVQRAQQTGLYGSIHRRHAAADHHHVAPDGQGGKIFGLSQLGDEIDRVAHALPVFALKPKRVHAAKTYAKKHGIMSVAKIAQRQFATQPFAGLQSDAADLKKPVDLSRSEIFGAFIGGDAKFVQATGFVAAVIEGHVMAMHRQTVRTGKTGGAGTNNPNRFAGGCGAHERMRALCH